MGSKMIRKVTSKSGRKMNREMGYRVTNNIHSIIRMKIKKKDG